MARNTPSTCPSLIREGEAFAPQGMGHPARHYALAFGSHGAGWQGLITDDSSEAEVGYPILSVPELQQSFGIALIEAGAEQFDLL